MEAPPPKIGNTASNLAIFDSKPSQEQLIINPLGKLRNNFLAKPTAPSHENPTHTHTHRRRASVRVSPTKPFGAVQQQQSQQLQLQPDFGDPTDRLNPTKRHTTCFPAEKFQVRNGVIVARQRKWNGNGNEIFGAREERSRMGLAGWLAGCLWLSSSLTTYRLRRDY